MAYFQDNNSLLWIGIIWCMMIMAHTAVAIQDNLLDSEFAIVEPFVASSHGEFISHNIRFAHGNSRRKRSAIVTESNDEFFVHFEVGNRTLLLNLTSNNKLLSPGFVLEKIDLLNDDKIVDDATLDQREAVTSIITSNHLPCHYHGYVVGEKDSRVAMSTCHGLHGLIRLDSGEYFIEPLEREMKEGGPQLHKIVRRDASLHSNVDNSGQKKKRKAKRGADEDEEFCGVADNKSKYNKSLRNRLLWEFTRHRRSSSRKSRNSRKRHRRSVSKERWIEAMVVVDKEMSDYYATNEEGYLENYVLTVMNMVADLFKDASIGNMLHLSVVRLVFLSGNEKDLHIGSHAEKTLGSFCKWARRINPDDDTHPQHHDVAVLLTRHDICSNNNHSCETLGLAHVAGMCQWHRSCNVNQDTGLSLAYTVAHEIGHNFAMHHDGQSNDCNANGNHPTVMAPHLVSNNKAMKWSSCSKNYITKFLDRNWGFCLSDKPVVNDSLLFPEQLPGVLYDANHQCRLMFGEKSRHCIGIDDVCNRLWCSSRGTCKSRLHSAAAGTSCGEGKWCYNGKCVSRNKEREAVDGGWSTWSEWHKCSRTCGVGITWSERTCDNPAPKHNGQYCLGERKRYRTCNKWKCGPDAIPFRDMQCTEFNNVKYKNKTYEWKSVDSTDYPCELLCYAETETNPISERMRNHVIDGTPCSYNNKGICVDGICRRLSCDKNIGSNATEDRCGVCQGDGSSCKKIGETFNKLIGEEYVEIGVLPIGARNIVIQEHNGSRNFLALRKPNNDSYYYLNGNFMIQTDTRFRLADTWFEYKRINGTTDRIEAKGPITKEIMVMLLFVEVNKGVNITYTVPTNESLLLDDENAPEFYWKLDNWSECSLTCGRGVQKSLAKCYEINSGEVDEDFCNSTTRPNDKHRSCNEEPCPAEWWIGEWQACSVSCGEKKGTEARTVICIQTVEGKEHVMVSESKCTYMPKPEKYRDCKLEDFIPCPIWRVQEWGQCSVTCGGGNSNRVVDCGSYAMREVINLDEEDSKVMKEDGEIMEPDYVNQFQVILNAQGVIEEMNYDTTGLEFVPQDSTNCDYTKKPIQYKPCNEFHCEYTIGYKQQHETTAIVEGPTESESFETTGVGFDDSIAKDEFDIDTTTTTTGKSTTTTTSKTTTLSKITTSANMTTTAKTTTKFLKSTSTLKTTTLPKTSTTTKSITTLKTTTPLKTTSTRKKYHKTTTPIKVMPPDEFDIATKAPIPEDKKLVKPKLESVNLRSHGAYFDEKPDIEAKWVSGDWSACSTTCGVGAKVRTVECSSGIDEDCAHSSRPAPAQICEEKPCTKWHYSEWSKCTANCGDGTRTKHGVCVDERTGEELRPYHCTHVPTIPTLTVTCNLHRCMPWKTSRWTPCNATCGSGVQRRRTACSVSHRCDMNMQPKTMKTCFLKKCVEWSPSEWTDCSVNCGGGIQKRTLNCIERNTNHVVKNSLCHPDFKPSKVRKCNEFKCRASKYDFASCTKDRLSSNFCKLLQNWGKCVQPSLAIQCCVTCQTFLNIRGKDKVS